MREIDYDSIDRALGFETAERLMEAHEEAADSGAATALLCTAILATVSERGREAIAAHLDTLLT